MATCVEPEQAVDGDETPPTGGGRLRPRPLRKMPKIRNVPADDLARHLLTLFALHPDAKEMFCGASESWEDLSRRLDSMGDRPRHVLLSRVNRYLGVQPAVVDED